MSKRSSPSSDFADESFASAASSAFDVLMAHDTSSSSMATTVSTSSSAPVTKKAKTTGPVEQKTYEQVLGMTEASLKASNKEQLIQYIITLQANAGNSGSVSTSRGAGGKELSQEELAALASKVADTVARGIRKQMTWKPSCKTGGAKFSYETLVPNRKVMLLALNRPVNEAIWKQKKLSIEELEEALGSISASVRYDTLYLKNNTKNADGPCITVKYDDDCKLTVSGSYGVTR